MEIIFANCIKIMIKDKVLEIVANVSGEQLNVNLSIIIGIFI